MLMNVVQSWRSQQVNLYGFMFSITITGQFPNVESGSTDVRSSSPWYSSDSVVLAVGWRRRAEGEGPISGQTVECPQHAIGHVIRKHPGTDQNAPERHLVGPVCAVPDLGKTGSEGKKTEKKKNNSGDKSNSQLIFQRDLFPPGTDTQFAKQNSGEMV